MAKTYTCRDVGVDLRLPVRGNDEADVMRGIKEHARAVDKMDPISARSRTKGFARHSGRALESAQAAAA